MVVIGSFVAGTISMLLIAVAAKLLSELAFTFGSSYGWPAIPRSCRGLQHARGMAP